MNIVLGVASSLFGIGVLALLWRLSYQDPSEMAAFGQLCGAAFAALAATFAGLAYRSQRLELVHLRETQAFEDAAKVSIWTEPCPEPAHLIQIRVMNGSNKSLHMLQFQVRTRQVDRGVWCRWFAIGDIKPFDSSWKSVPPGRTRAVGLPDHKAGEQRESRCLFQIGLTTWALKENGQLEHFSS